ncbi:MAG: hypothetical protein KGJ80_01825 [Chloroflexota bacterium]|nr:hypothetical protein [Chloroflexota bacterium]
MQNKWLRFVLIAIGAVLALCILVGAGIFVVRWSSRASHRETGLFRRLFTLTREHGAVGAIESIGNQTLTLALRDGTTQTVLLDSTTRIEESAKRITLADLKVGDHVAVIGSPDSQGQIRARWIRVVNPPPSERVTPTPTGFQ